MRSPSYLSAPPALTWLHKLSGRHDTRSRRGQRSAPTGACRQMAGDPPSLRLLSILFYFYGYRPRGRSIAPQQKYTLYSLRQVS